MLKDYDEIKEEIRNPNETEICLMNLKNNNIK